MLHRARRYQPYQDLLFARGEMAVELVLRELAEALTSFPLAVLRQGETDLLVAVLSVKPGANFYVAPSGEWLGAYVPALFRAYPFALAEPPVTPQPLLCIDEAMLVEEASGAGEPLFDEAGAPGPMLERARGFMTQYLADRQLTRHAVAQLRAAGLLAPWKIQVQQADGALGTLDGLWHLDEAALNRQSPEQLAALRDSHALGLAYAQILSERRMKTLQQLAIRHEKAVASQKDFDERLQGMLTDDGGALQFDF